MFQNFLLIATGVILAASWFITPHLLAGRRHGTSALAVIALYGVAGAISLLLADARSAFVVVELGLIFTLLGKVFALNLAMVHTARHPKNLRCY